MPVVTDYCWVDISVVPEKGCEQNYFLLQVHCILNIAFICLL